MRPAPPVVLQPLPVGWSYATTVTPAIQRKAVEVLGKNYPYGSGEVAEFGGVLYAFRLEPHYDDHVGGVLKWHPGISVWQRNDVSAAMPSFVSEDSRPQSAISKASAGPGARPYMAFLIGVGIGYLGWAARG